MYQGEKTLLVTRPTRLVSLRYYVGMFFSLILGVLFYFQIIQRFAPSFPNPGVMGQPLSTIFAGVFLFFALLALLAAELLRKTTRYIITDNKIIREDGILSKRTAMSPYTQLERVDLNQSLLQRILRIGTIVIDTGDDSLNMDMIPHPREVQDLLSNRIGRRAYSGPEPPNP